MKKKTKREEFVGGEMFYALLKQKTGAYLDAKQIVDDLRTREPKLQRVTELSSASDVDAYFAKTSQHEREQRQWFSQFCAAEEARKIASLVLFDIFPPKLHNIKFKVDVGGARYSVCAYVSPNTGSPVVDVVKEASYVSNTKPV